MPFSVARSATLFSSSVVEHFPSEKAVPSSFVGFIHYSFFLLLFPPLVYLGTSSGREDLTLVRLLFIPRQCVHDERTGGFLIDERQKRWYLRHSSHVLSCEPTRVVLPILFLFVDMEHSMNVLKNDLKC